MKRILQFSHALLVILLILSLLAVFGRSLPHFSTSIIGRLDAANQSLWHLWWSIESWSHADTAVLTTYSAAPYLSNRITYLPFVQGGVFATLNWVIPNPLVAFQLTLAVLFTATYVSVYVWFTSCNVEKPVSAVAATLFVTSSWYVTTAQAAIDIVALGLFLLPLSLFCWDRFSETGRLRWMLATVFVLWLAVLSGLAHLTWIIVIVIPYAIHRLNQVETLSSLFTTLRLGISLLLILFLLYPLRIIFQSLQGNLPPYGASFVATGATFESVAGLILESGMIGFLLIGIIGLSKQKAPPGFWLTLFGVSFVLGLGFLPDPLHALGALFGLQGQTAFLPQMYLGLIQFCAVAAFVDAWPALKSKLPAAGLWTGLGMLVAASYVAVLILVPYSRQELQILDIYRDIEREPEDYLILDYPAGIQSTQTGLETGTDSYLSLYAVWHHKRTVSGIAPYFSDEVHQAVDESTIFNLSFINDLSTDMLATIIEQDRIGYVLVHHRLLSDEESDALTGLLSASEALCQPITQADVSIYRAQWHPAGCFDDLD